MPTPDDTASGQRDREEMPTVNALLVPADLSEPCRVVPLTNGLATMQHHVGGLVDVQEHPNFDAWCNDEGRLNGSDINTRFAHFLLHDSEMARNGGVYESQMLYGDLLLTGPCGEYGETTSVRPEIVDYFSALKVERDAVREWDVKSVEWTVTDWPDDFGLGR